jgi:hypothetical protein
MARQQPSFNRVLVQAFEIFHLLAGMKYRERDKVPLSFFLLGELGTFLPPSFSSSSLLLSLPAGEPATPVRTHGIHA